jgi:hypothetical protein
MKRRGIAYNGRTLYAPDVAEVKGPDGKTVATATPGGNTHGSICEINGQWHSGLRQNSVYGRLLVRRGATDPL